MSCANYTIGEIMYILDNGGCIEVVKDVDHQNGSYDGIKTYIRQSYVMSYPEELSIHMLKILCDKGLLVKYEEYEDKEDQKIIMIAVSRNGKNKLQKKERI